MGDHLRKKRLDLGPLQKEVAQSLGVDTDSVTNWEQNRHAPTLHLLPRIRKFLGYSPFCGDGKNLGQRILEMRRTLGIRQDRLARQLGVDPSTLARWERGIKEPIKGHEKHIEEILMNLQPCLDN